MKEKISAILTKRYPFWQSKSINEVCRWIEEINAGTIKKTDWFTQSEGKVTYEDVIYALELNEFITT